jgi:beta-glucosidase
VELYLKFPNIPGAPIRALRGFQRIHLDPGASQKVEFRLNPRDLSMVTEAGDIIEAQGKYTVSLGGGQPGPGVQSVSGDFEIKGQIMLPE